MRSVHEDVCHMFVDSFTSVSEKITGFSLEYNEEEKEFQSAQNVKIQSVGTFRASLFFSMDKDFEQAVFLAMAKNISSKEELKELMIGEFINIISGHALTKINNLSGKTSRLTVPLVGPACWEDKEKFPQQCTVFFQSAYGKMRMDMGYECDF
ncbi:MAG: chemotaxis protein CheX [Lachnospiraceae bacterium]|nr:chemotaxis protein CheX [Lachnospiraceae bacterium]